jgi:hypothetical protein
MTTFRHGEHERGLARAAYQTFEPYHLVAYFGPHVDTTRERLGIGWLGAYTGMRAAPLGPVPAAVVAATFFGFRPAAIAKAWGLALDRHTPAELDEIRTSCVDAGLRAALGDLVDSPDLARQAERMRALIAGVDTGGRPLAAAYAALPWPEEPHLALWHATTLWREWRGDGHNAALVSRGLRPLEALVLYDADLRDLPERQAAGRGRPFLQPTRKWSDEEWAATTDALAVGGLVTVSGDTVTLTEAGSALRREVEDTTDDAAAAVWVGVEDAEDLVASFRPFSKAVIVSGILPGTTKR